MKPQTIIVVNEAARQQAIDHIAGLSLKDGKQWEVTAERHRKRRSLRQNSLYWAYCDKVAEYVADYTGYSREDCHEFFKQRFLPGRRIEIEGMEAVRFTTTGLNTKQMFDYTNEIYRWASTELGLVLPLPPVATEERR